MFFAYDPFGFLILLQWSFSAMLYFWPITAVLMAILSTEIPFAPKTFKRQYMLSLLPLLFPTLSLCWGAIMWISPVLQNWRLESWPEQLLTLSMLMQLLVSYIVWNKSEFKRNWGFFLSVLLIETWFGICCQFIAGMAVTGLWL